MKKKSIALKTHVHAHRTHTPPSYESASLSGAISQHASWSFKKYTARHTDIHTHHHTPNPLLRSPDCRGFAHTPPLPPAPPHAPPLARPHTPPHTPTHARTLARMPLTHSLVSAVSPANAPAGRELN